jgi:hypothetical protein
MDFCYWANALVLLYVWWFPKDAQMFQIIFLVANGPLAWSMLAFNHSMIFHSYPHITSVFIHASPMLLTFGLRWHSTERSGFIVCDGLAEPGEPCTIPSTKMVHAALTKFYLLWIFCYYIAVFVVMNDYIRKKGFQTLYDRVTEKGPLRRVLQMVDGGHLKKVVYLFCHLMYGVVTMFIATIYWQSYLGHLLFIITIMTSTAWNGGNFYFNAFSRQQDAKLAKIATESQTKHKSE